MVYEIRDKRKRQVPEQMGGWSLARSKRREWREHHRNKGRVHQSEGHQEKKGPQKRDGTRKISMGSKECHGNRCQAERARR